MTQTRIKELRDLLENVLLAEFGRASRRFELIVNQGGVQNREISPEGKAAVKEGLRRHYDAESRPMSTVNGRIACNLAEGRLVSLNWGIEPHQR